MYERSAIYFQQFQKQFGFKNVDQKPTDITNLISYAVWPHLESEFCQIATNHFHLLIDRSTAIGSTKENKPFAVLCLFTTFKHLFLISSKLETNGDVFTKLKLAVGFNDKTGKNWPSNGSQASSSFLLNHSQGVDDDRNEADENYRNRTENNPQYNSQQQPAMNKLKVTKFVQKL